MAEETKDYKKGLPFSLIVGMLLIILIYIAINLVYLYLIPISEMVNTKLIGSSVMGILYGDFGKRVMEILVIISSLGCINAMIITGSRVTYAMAKDNVLFNYISKVNLKYRTPIRAIIINAIWSVVLIWWGTFNKLLFFTSLVVWLFFALVVGGLFILRAKFPDRERPFKVYFYPLVPIIFILICSALFINTIICFPMESCIGLGIMACGIPIYLFSERRK
jgi:APA family basic amino acid/polyamine antiporter